MPITLISSIFLKKEGAGEDLWTSSLHRAVQGEEHPFMETGSLFSFQVPFFPFIPFPFLPELGGSRQLYTTFHECFIKDYLICILHPWHRRCGHQLKFCQQTELTALKLSFVLKCGVFTLSCRSEAQSASSLLQHSSTLESVKQITSQSRAPPGEDAPITNVHFKAVGKRDL